MPSTGIAHHLSGPSRRAHTHKCVADAHIPANIFVAQSKIVVTHELAGMLDSLVRVSRRDERAHALFRAAHAQVGQKCAPALRQADISPGGGLMR